MLLVEYFDWMGTEKELKEIDDEIKKIASSKKDIKYLGRYSPHQKKFQWCWVFESDSYDKLIGPSMLKGGRNFKLMPYGSVEVFSGPV